jgi:hypothetical protein
VAKPERKVDAKADLKSDNKSDRKPEVKAGSKPDAKSDPRAEPVKAAKPVVKTEPKRDVAGAAGSSGASSASSADSDADDPIARIAKSRAAQEAGAVRPAAGSTSAIGAQSKAAKSGSYRHRPFRRPFSSTGAYHRCFATKNKQKSLKNNTPSAASGPFSQTGFPRLCSLYVVICVFFEDFGYEKTSKSPRQASTDGGGFLDHTGKPLETCAVFECFCSSLLLPRGISKKGPQISQKRPQIGTPGPQKDPKK